MGLCVLVWFHSSDGSGPDHGQKAEEGTTSSKVALQCVIRRLHTECLIVHVMTTMKGLLTNTGPLSVCNTERIEPGRSRHMQ